MVWSRGEVLELLGAVITRPVWITSTGLGLAHYQDWSLIRARGRAKTRLGVELGVGSQGAW